MSRFIARWVLCLATSALLAVPVAGAKSPKPVLSFVDPAGDDSGPGSYIYPTDPAFSAGSFDLVGVTVVVGRREVTIRVKMAAPITDPWASSLWQGHGFSLQLLHIYFDTKAKRGATSALPGIRGRFAKKDRWDKVVVVSAENPSLVKKRLRKLRGFKRSALVLPKRIVIDGDTIIVTVKRSQLGKPSKKWGMQVVVGSSDTLAVPQAWWVRGVDVQAGPYRFGGGLDGDCDPAIIDILDSPAEKQATTLAFERCADEPKFKVTLPMMRHKSL